MGFNDLIKKIIHKEKPLYLDVVCVNFWCKAPFKESKTKMIQQPEIYSQCPKCRSFSQDLSSGVQNNGVKHYEGERFSDEPQETNYSIQNDTNAILKRMFGK